MPIDVNGNIISGTSFNTIGDILNEPSVVTDGLILWYDAGNLASYLNSSSYYDCGYGCQYYASDPGCTSCNTQWKDMSGYANDGTLYNISAVTYDNYGGSFYFNGTNYYVQTPIHYPVLWSDNVTFEIWMYVPSTVTWNTSYWSGLFSAGSYTGSHGLGRVNIDNYVGLYIRGDSTIAVSGQIGRDSWYHVVGTWNATQATIFINGVQGNSSGSGMTGTPGVVNLHIGKEMAFGGAQGSYYEGYISIARLYNRALTSNEIIQNFNNGRLRFSI